MSIAHSLDSFEIDDELICISYIWMPISILALIIQTILWAMSVKCWLIVGVGGQFIYLSTKINHANTLSLKFGHKLWQLIFNQNIFESFDSKLFKIVDDLNFMNAFCFGNETNLEIKTLKDVLKDSSISGHPFIEYSGRLIENDSLTFLMEFFLTFNFVNGSIYFKENYSYFLEDYLNAEDWDSFKSVFMNHYGSNKINKNLNDVILKDSTIAQMLNL